MLTMNLRQRDEKGILIVGIIDMYSNGEEEAIKPFPMGAHPLYESWTNHADNIIKVIRSYVPNAQIYLVPHTEEGAQYLIDAECEIVNISLAGYTPSTIYSKLANKTFIVASAGNDGITKGESWLSLQDYSCAVGAVDSNLNPMSYSGYGKGAVKTVAIQPVLEGKTLRGTSFSSPVIVGLLSQWKIWYKSVMGVCSTIKQTNEFVKVNSHDIFEEGNDLRTGYGLLRLPKEFAATEVVVKAGNRVAQKIYHVEGKPTLTEEVDLLEVPFIKNNRTFVPSNGLTSSLGISVHWNSEQHTSHYVQAITFRR